MEDRVVVIDSEATSPPYRQVREQLTAGIRDGSLPVGTRLPTVRALAADLGLAPNTVARAYRELEAAGLVATQGRRGTFVAASGSEVVRRAMEAARTYAATVQALGLAPDDALELVTTALRPISTTGASGGSVGSVDLRRSD